MDSDPVEGAALSNERMVIGLLGSAETRAEQWAANGAEMGGGHWSANSAEMSSAAVGNDQRTVSRWAAQKRASRRRAVVVAAMGGARRAVLRRVTTRTADQAQNGLLFRPVTILWGHLLRTTGAFGEPLIRPKIFMYPVLLL